jgi:hypothetical protein
METLPVTLGTLAISLVLLATGFVLYTYFPVVLHRREKQAITYRHEGYLLFLVLFLPSLFLPIAKVATENNQLCDIVLMQSVAGGLTTNNSYAKVCYNETTHNGNSLFYVAYSNYRWFFWLYFGTMLVFYLVAMFNNYFVNRGDAHR